jgi:hypothetical protein
LQVEIKVVFARYDQSTINGLSVDLATKAEKWKLETKATSFTIKEKKMKKINNKNINKVRRWMRLKQKINKINTKTLKNTQKNPK